MFTTTDTTFQDHAAIRIAPNKFYSFYKFFQIRNARNLGVVHTDNLFNRVLAPSQLV